jgi:hypothetical protein
MSQCYKQIASQSIAKTVDQFMLVIGPIKLPALLEDGRHKTDVLCVSMFMY